MGIFLTQFHIWPRHNVSTCFKSERAFPISLGLKRKGVTQDVDPFLGRPVRQPWFSLSFQEHMVAHPGATAKPIWTVRGSRQTLIKFRISEDFLPKLDEASIP